MYQSRAFGSQDFRYIRHVFPKVWNKLLKQLPLPILHCIGSSLGFLIRNRSQRICIEHSNCLQKISKAVLLANAWWSEVERSIYTSPCFVKFRTFRRHVIFVAFRFIPGFGGAHAVTTNSNMTTTVRMSCQKCRFPRDYFLDLLSVVVIWHASQIAQVNLYCKTIVLNVAVIFADAYFVVNECILTL